MIPMDQTKATKVIREAGLNLEAMLEVELELIALGNFLDDGGDAIVLKEAVEQGELNVADFNWRNLTEEDYFSRRKRIGEFNDELRLAVGRPTANELISSALLGTEYDLEQIIKSGIRPDPLARGLEVGLDRDLFLEALGKHLDPQWFNEQNFGLSGAECTRALPGFFTMTESPTRLLPVDCSPRPNPLQVAELLAALHAETV
ncbi:MAG: hypothetical protein K2W82_16795 [Candidatus Obscuribacterales bacterium]|nr:hypothetical protein [Candidatus Obscuribacterales bacterium]